MIALLRGEKLMDGFRKKIMIDERSKYWEMVKEPMWLDLVEENLKKGMYKERMPLFKKHVNLMFQNAIDFHAAGTRVSAQAWKMKNKLPSIF